MKKFTLQGEFVVAFSKKLYILKVDEKSSANVLLLLDTQLKKGRVQMFVATRHATKIRLGSNVWGGSIRLNRAFSYTKGK